MNSFDLIVVGAGPAGCVVAERASNVLGWTVLVVEKRPHIGGNCYDRVHESGIFIHEYGPHYYRTNSQAQIDYLSRFTGWIPGRYFVKSLVNKRLFPFPINLTTLEMFFNRELDEQAARGLLESVREKIEHPRNSEEQVVSTIGRELYEAFFLNYTVKHWGIHPRDLDASVCARIPVRLNRDDRYVDHRFQLLPRDGYTHMFQNMLQNSPLITTLVNCDFRNIRDLIRARKATVYTGPLDEYFSFARGPLPYRSVRYEHEIRSVPFAQRCVQINYPNDFDYTRSVEYKHITGQQAAHTLVAYEYASSAGDPSYPIPASFSEKVANEYRAMAAAETLARRVYFVGRLAEYRYYNIDQAIDRALNVFNQLRRI